MLCDGCRNKRRCLAECLGYDPHGPFYIKPPKSRPDRHVLFYVPDIEALEVRELSAGRRIRKQGHFAEDSHAL